MTRTTTAHPRDGLRYWLEPLPGKRAQLHADLVDGGRLASTWPVGSPAPLASVQAALDEHNRGA